MNPRPTLVEFPALAQLRRVLTALPGLATLPRVRGWLSGAALLSMVLGVGACGDSAPPAQQSFNRGTRFMNDGEIDRAITAFQEGLELEPTSAVGRNLLGMAYRVKFNEERAGRWKDLELEAFRMAVAADSTYWPACINLGATLYFQGEHGEASEWFRRALELNPDNPERERIERMIEAATREESDSPSGS